VTEEPEGVQAAAEAAADIEDIAVEDR